jgi:hypothetical protein
VDVEAELSERTLEGGTLVVARRRYHVELHDGVQLRRGALERRSP